MTARGRYELAQAKTTKLVNSLEFHLQTHANNLWIAYSDEIWKRIGETHAARAINTFRSNCAHYELLRLCAFWDDLDFDKFSIPTIAFLVDHPDVHRIVYDTAHKVYEVHDPSNARPWGEKVRQRLEDVIDDVKSLKVAAGHIDRLENFRHKIAHHLEQTTHEKNIAPIPIDSPTLEDANELLDSTISAVEMFESCLQSSSRDWVVSREVTETSARTLWERASLAVPE